MQSTLRFIACACALACSAPLAPNDAGDALPDSSRESPDSSREMDAAPPAESNAGAREESDAGAPVDPDAAVPFDPIRIVAPPDTEAPIPCGGTSCGEYQACYSGACGCLPGYVPKSISGGRLECVLAEVRCLRALLPDRFMVCFPGSFGESYVRQDNYFVALREVGDPVPAFDSRGASSAFGVATEDVPLVGLDRIADPEGTCWGRVEDPDDCALADSPEWCDFTWSCYRSAFREESCNALPGCAWTPPPPPAPLGCSGYEQQLGCRADRTFRTCVNRLTGRDEYRFDDGRVIRSRYTAHGYCQGLTDEPVEGWCVMVDPSACESMSDEDCYTGEDPDTGIVHACHEDGDGRCTGSTVSCAISGLTPEICNAIPGCAFEPLEP
jgi:hypothetical protein